MLDILRARRVVTALLESSHVVHLETGGNRPYYYKLNPATLVASRVLPPLPSGGPRRSRPTLTPTPTPTFTLTLTPTLTLPRSEKTAGEDEEEEDMGQGPNAAEVSYLRDP